MSLERPFVIAVDGPAGSGKSSVSRRAAAVLGFAYLDTGAAYRALTWKVLDDGADAAQPTNVIGILPRFALSIGTDPDNFFVRVDGTDVTGAIREPWVTSEVKLVSRLPDVRTHLTHLFRDAIRNTAKPGIVVEGRDITTNVAADAPLRVLLTASEDVRMTRRTAELVGGNAREAGENLRKRDRADSMVTDFLTASDGVATLDSTELDFEETVDTLVQMAYTAGAPRASHPTPARPV